MLKMPELSEGGISSCVLVTFPSRWPVGPEGRMGTMLSWYLKKPSLAGKPLPGPLGHAAIGGTCWPHPFKQKS